MGEAVIPDYLNDAILASPLDDTPRGAAADWLEEYAADLPNPDAARARAEFIRVQVELARPVPPKPKKYAHLVEFGRAANRPGRLLGAYQKLGRYEAELAEHIAAVKARKPLQERENELAASRHLEEAFKPLINGVMYWTTDSLPIHVEQSHVIVRRGFVDELSCHIARFDMLAHLLFTHHPITRVRLIGLVPRQVRDILSTGWTWSRECLGAADHIHVLPDYIRDRLPRQKCQKVPLGFLRWDTEGDARDALSAACVRLGRERAKLPELASYQPLISPVQAAQGRF